MQWSARLRGRLRRSRIMGASLLVLILLLGKKTGVRGLSIYSIRAPAKDLLATAPTPFARRWGNRISWIRPHPQRRLRPSVCFGSVSGLGEQGARPGAGGISSWGPLPLGSKHRQGLARSYVRTGKWSLSSGLQVSVTNIPAGDAPLRLGGGGGGGPSIRSFRTQSQKHLLALLVSSRASLACKHSSCHFKISIQLIHVVRYLYEYEYCTVRASIAILFANNKGTNTVRVRVLLIRRLLQYRTVP